MTEFSTFFRHCPSCGRRFEIRLVAKVELRDEAEYGTVKAESATPHPMGMKESSPTLGVVNLTSGGPSIAEIPEISDVRTFRYLFRCQHCGHEWTEERSKSKLERVKGEYKGD